MMVLNVMVQALLKAQAGVGPEAALADEPIEGFSVRNEAAVHGVVSHDEQSCVQKAPQQNKPCHQQRVGLLNGKPESSREGDQPGGPD